MGSSGYSPACDIVLRHADANGREACRRCLTNLRPFPLGLLVEYNGQGSRPERPSNRPGSASLVHLSDLLHLVDRGKVDDEWVVQRPTLGLVDGPDSLVVCGVSPKTVDSLRRESHQLPPLQEVRSDFELIFGEDPSLHGGSMGRDGARKDGRTEQGKRICVAQGLVPETGP